MIRLITLTQPRVAQAFIDYMASRQIEVKMMPEGGGQFTLWLLDVEQQIEAEAELKHFLDNPNDAKYQAASWDMAETRQNHFKYSSPSMMTMIKAKAGPFSLLSMALCIGIFVLQQVGYGEAVFRALHFPAFAGQEWQLWRWLSHGLLHFSIMHIAFNLLWWWQLGGDIEQRLGTGKLVQLFIFSAALSGIGQYWVEGANFGGLSGVVYALVGYTWLMGVRAPQFGLSMPKPVFGFMIAWLVLGYIQPVMAIANTAHLVGLIAGLLVALFDSSRK
ncbi:rhomboid family intramembrane serine protease GlpG [Vibrio intestinalis]|uniref:rhomboid family intramembrane serine protease GlpG n=1 Tax=Vibrio intestinalis TaxID=2933291 RepID=UPI0021A382D6|nr:rhomboid family intramembrane serine protease GlpG [Vibrio intestinalis]